MYYNVYSVTDKARKLIKLTGKKELVGETKRAIFALLQPRAADEADPDLVKRTQGTPAYLRLLGSESVVRYPVYWQNAKNADFSLSVESKRQQLRSGDPLYKEVEKLVIGTGEADKIGHGRDALNLSYRSVSVRNIWVIENPSLFAEFMERKKRLCKIAAVNGLPPRISGLKGEHEVKTQKIGIFFRFLSIFHYVFTSDSEELHAV